MGKKINISDLDEIIINPGDLVIDCGANVGKVTDYFSSKGATVIAFEPNQFAFSYLKEKFKYKLLIKVSLVIVLLERINYFYTKSQ